MHIVQTENLSHSFSSGETIIKSLNLQVISGSIYGFLGPNGAGKTTTLRLILGLYKTQQGSITIFDKSLSQNRIEILKDVGSLIESPSIYEHLTAYENLLLLQKIYQSPKQRITTVLDLVALSSTETKKTKEFSLGMKQRLSLAIALLHNPSLLILDEPTNGLDPNGIIEMRELLKRLNHEEGTTIIISSHLLAEIEKIATHVGIINKGQLLFQGTLKELMNKREESSFVVLDTSNNDLAISILNSNQIVAETLGTKIRLIAATKRDIDFANRLLINQNIDVYELSLCQSDLESVFMNVIGQ
jgi:lantibiotic transport system ATP-binding protein